MRDELAIDPPEPGMTVLNYGDPAYRFKQDRAASIKLSEEIFLRFISYLPFAEAVIVPGRHLLDGREMFKAAVLAKPLLMDGVIVPEQREGPTCFGELARQRNLHALAMQRADFIDHSAKRVRRFRWGELSATYKNILEQDLAPEGAFRRVVPGSIKGKLKHELDAAHEEYVASDDVTPDGFFKAVKKYCLPAASAARQWAMAHYYLTPTMFDDLNIRQIPRSASDLLIQGGVLDEAIRKTDMLAPAEYLRNELTSTIQVLDVEHNSNAYCEAILRVRQEIPEARKLFRSLWDRVDAKEASEAIAELMRRELQRQLRTPFSSKHMFSLGINIGSSFMGGVAGGVAGLPFGAPVEGVLVGTAVGSGVSLSAWAGEKMLPERFARKRRPWKLAVDRLKTRLKNA
jgi:hypothetical protein